MAKVFLALAKERRFRKVAGGIIVEYAKDYAPKPTDHDFIRKSDVPWLNRFAEAGGRAIISGNVAMRHNAHERLALFQNNLTAIFFENQWNEWDFFRKSALLLHWWEVIFNKVRTAKRGTFWVIPCSWQANGELRDVSLGQVEMFKKNPERSPRPESGRVRKRPPAPIKRTDERQPGFLAMLEKRDADGQET